MQSSAEVYNIYFDQEINTVVMEWEGYSTIEQFREGSELMLNLLVKHNAQKVLANIKNMVLIGKEEQDWLLHTFLPRAVSFGFEAIALVRPAFYFNNVAIESISGRIAGRKPELKVFNELEEALAWIGTGR